jgi:peptidoglycan/xylan/chitin deacetylase (PgdA/CDA1 family)
MATRCASLAASLLVLAGCTAATGQAAADPPADPAQATTGWTAPAGTGSDARVVLTAPLYDSPGSRVPIIVTVQNPPPGLPTDSLGATASDSGLVTDCGGNTWENPVDNTISRTCYLIAPASNTRIQLFGHANWINADGRRMLLNSAPVRFRTSGAASGAVSRATAARIESCGNPGPAVWLTFDDFVPSVEAARSLVAVLGRNHARGRFFLNHVSNEVRAILESAGHIIEDHTRDHLAMTDLTDDQIHEQITGGPHPTAGAPALLRPPYGAGAEATRVVDLTAKDGYATCRWTVDTRDWAGFTPARMAEAVRYGNSFTPPVAAGGVILMHANHFTPQKLQAVIDAVHARGLRVDSADSG